MGFAKTGIISFSSNEVNLVIEYTRSSPYLRLREHLIKGGAVHMSLTSTPEIKGYQRKLQNGPIV